MVDILAGLLFLLCLPALLPPATWGLFSGSPELIVGPYTDLTGASLALMLLGAALQRVAAGSLLAALFVLPFVPGGPIPQVAAYLAALLLSSLFAGFTSGISKGYSFAR
jgi:formate hydrogenlyase subunit 4